MPLPRPAACLTVIVLSGCGPVGVDWSAEFERSSRGYPADESARIDDDMGRLRDEEPLKHHDDEEELRRHAFERDFYEDLYDRD